MYASQNDVNEAELKSTFLLTNECQDKPGFYEDYKSINDMPLLVN
jgi:hypothetical protein